MKLVVNAYMSVLIEGVAETMALADRLGIGHPQLAGVIEGGPLDAPIADANLHNTDRRLCAGVPPGVDAERCGPGAPRRG